METDLRQITLSPLGNDYSNRGCIPIRLGLPFAKKALDARCEPSLQDGGGQSVVSQWRPVLFWPDGSVQWGLLDFIPSDSDSYRLTSVPTKPAVANSSSAKQPTDPSARTSFKVELPKARAEFMVKLADGSPLNAVLQETRMIEQGALRESVLFSGNFVDGSQQATLDWCLHLHHFPTCGARSWSLTLRNSRPAQHPGGIWELGDSNSVLLKQFNVEFKANSSFRTSQFRPEVEANWRNSTRVHLAQLGSGGENFQSPIHKSADGSVHAPLKGYRLSIDDQTVLGTRATPMICVSADDNSSLGLWYPRFWQNFPKGIQLESDVLRLSLFPQEFGAPIELQPGEQKTHQFWTVSGERSEDVVTLLDELVNLPTARISAQEVCETGVIPWLTPVAEEKFPDYLSLVNQAVQGTSTFKDKRERVDEYGWRNFGEAYGDHESVYSEPDKPLMSHYNNQYDMVLGLGLNYLRGGDVEWLELMEDLARHTIDIDIYHTTQDRPAYNQGMYWHTVHYVDAGLATHRAYPRGTCGGGPSSGHAYARGLLLHYCLTGDETAREAVIGFGDWMIAAEDGSATKYRWLAGGETGLTTASGNEYYHGPGRGPGNAVEVLLTAHQLTQNKKYLDQAEKVIRRVVHPKQDIQALDLLDAENKWFYLIFLQALGRYLEFKIDAGQIDFMYAYAQACLRHFSEWMVKNECFYLDKPEKLEYPNETWAAQEMRKVEVFQWAARHSVGKQRERLLERATYFFGRACERLHASGDKKSLCRPIALLLSNGYSHSWFATDKLANIAPAPISQVTDFGVFPIFVSQKSKAIRRAKVGLIAILAISLIAAACGVWVLFS